MGNDLRKAGVRPGATVDTAMVDTLWAELDRKHTGYLSKPDAMKFLQAFCKQAHIQWNPQHAESMLEFCGGGSSGAKGLSKEIFVFVLAKEAEFGRMLVSGSVANLTHVTGAQAQLHLSGVHTAKLLSSLRAASEAASEARAPLERAQSEYAAAGLVTESDVCGSIAATLHECQQALNMQLLNLGQQHKDLLNLSHDGGTSSDSPAKPSSPRGATAKPSSPRAAPAAAEQPGHHAESHDDVAPAAADSAAAAAAAPAPPSDSPRAV
jgi:hypothetical protein